MNVERPARRGALEGVRILEFGSLLAGPYVARLLGDYGADVIKVEAPDAPDILREFGVNRFEGKALWWPIQSRNKRLITLNLRDPRGAEIARELLKQCDVLVENFRPGTLENWGLSPAVLEEINPRLIVARVSGYGQTGPYAERPGYASVGEAMGGMRYINGYPGEAPPRTGLSLGDSLAALFATIGVLAALHNRDVGDGRGQVVDASIMESCFALLESIVPEYAKVGAVREPSGSTLAHVSPSNVYKSRDGKWMVIAANNEPVWRRLCIALGQPEWLDDQRFATLLLRAQNMAVLDEMIAAWAGERNAVDIDKEFGAAGIVCGPVYSIADIFHDPQYKAREMIVEMEDPDLGTIAAPGIVPKFSRTPGEIKFTGSQQMGAHNEEVYRELLGYDAEALAQLRADGII